MLDFKQFKRSLKTSSQLIVEMTPCGKNATITLYCQTKTTGNSYIVPATINDKEIVQAQYSLAVQDDNGTFISNLAKALSGSSDKEITVDFIRSKEQYGDCGIDCIRFNVIDCKKQPLVTNIIDCNVFFSPVKQRAIQRLVDLPNHLKDKFISNYNGILKVA